MTHNFLLETPRLFLRELNEDDSAFAFELNDDPEVIQYTGDDAFPTLEAARAFLKAYDAYEKTGMGRWGVELKETNELIGWCGLKLHADDNTYDLGYRFLKKHWGKGYATEASLACLKHGFETLNLSRIYAEARVENLGSIQVLKKLGFKFYKNGMDCGGDTVIYEFFKDEFSK